MLETDTRGKLSINQYALITEADKAIPWTLQDWSLLFLASGAAIMLLRLIIQQISFIVSGALQRCC
jgi:hypothetical protein